MRKFSVERIPTLVFVKDQKVVDRIDGRANMPQIEKLLEAHLPQFQPA